MSTDVISLLAPLFTVLYFVPYFVAYQRKHKNRTPIFLTNLLLGWTVLGWLIALIWSASAHVESQTAA